MLVPRGVLGQSVVSNEKRTRLLGCQMGKVDDRNLFQSNQPGGLDPAVPGDDLPLGVHQDGNVEPKAANAFSDLCDLLLAMQAGILGIRLELGKRTVPHLEGTSSCANIANWTF